MKINFKLCLIVFVFSSSLMSCTKRNVFTGNDYSEFTINGVTKYGNFEKDPVLKALTIPCQGNSTLRMYYSDSAATLGLPQSRILKVVSYLKAGHLAYDEIYLEVTTSTVDTYLSTGKAGDNFIYFGPGSVSELHSITVQHFTSSPQADSTTVSAIFRPI